MTFRLPRPSLVNALPLLLALGACSGERRGPLPVALAGDEAAFQTAGARLSPAGQVLRAATVEGLVGFDAEGRVVPAIAERWIVTDDGLGYIFRLREGTWPDGSAIDAQSVATALRRARTTLAGTALGLDLAPIEDIRVMTDRVVEIDLAAPMPDLLTLLAQPEMGLPRARRGAGPLGLRRNGAAATLSPIPPEQRGMPPQEGFARHVRALHLELVPMGRAVQRFNDGLVDVALGGTTDTLPLAGATMLSRGNVQLDPVTGLYGLMVAEAGADAFAGDPLRREALALAIDRDALVAGFGLGGWAGTTRLVSAEAADADETIGERWPGTTIEQRQALARSRVAAWVASGRPQPVLRLAAPDGPGTRLVVTRLTADFAAIGVRLEHVAPDGRADLVLVDAVARYGRVAWFLDQLACGVAPVCSHAGDLLVGQAAHEHDPARRAVMLAEAERQITAVNGYIPLARPLRWSLVRSGVKGFAANPWGWHSLAPLAQIGK